LTSRTELRSKGEAPRVGASRAGPAARLSEHGRAVVVTKPSLSTPSGAEEVACRSAIRCEGFEKFCG